MESKTLTGPDYSAYDAFVVSHPRGSVFQTRAWMRYQFAAFGRGGEIIVVEEQGRILCSALVIYHTLPFGKSYAYVPRGPLFSDNRAANGMLLTALRREASHGSGIFVLMDPLIPHDAGWESVTSSKKLHATTSHQPNTTLIIDMRPEEDAILSQMKEKGRYNIRLAVKKGVTVRQGRRVEELYPMLEETAKRDGFAIHPIDVYQTMLEIFGDQARLLIAEHEGSVLAGGIFLFVGTTAIYYYGASRTEGREYMAPYLLQWEAMHEAKRRGCEEYDLLGIADPGIVNHPLSGVTEFKTKFGGEVRQYVGARKMVVNHLWNTLYELRRKF